MDFIPKRPKRVGRPTKNEIPKVQVPIYIPLPLAMALRDRTYGSISAVAERALTEFFKRQEKKEEEMYKVVE